MATLNFPLFLKPGNDQIDYRKKIDQLIEKEDSHGTRFNSSFSRDR